ncbi:hypothetical protein [Haloarchaeobius amylolyticus]|uniref:hypothetical protein n=1 Tax=Haloarchaeobius amylolyticus TaxID=1198296 RepID=UPI0022718C59|nr:hypothetical protein [Haloarchaeobius amylolyticus]
MIDRATQAALFALYQTSIALGIVLMPLALAMRRFGVSLPVHRLVERFGGAYEETAAN